MATLLLIGHFVASKVGKTGLADVAIDLWRIALADGTASEVVTAGACTEVGDGLYRYRYASADLATYQYAGVFKTADSSVDAQHVAALGLVVPDELISSRLATAGYTAPANVDIAAVKAKTDNLPAAPAAVGSAMTLTAAYDAAKTAAQAGDEMGLSEAALADVAEAVGEGVTVNATVAVSAAEAESLAEGSLALTSYHAFSQAITSTSTDDLSTATLAFAIKLREADADAASIAFVRSDTGLTVVAGAAYATGAHGSIAVSGSSGAWEITVTLNATVTGLLDGYAGRKLPSALKNLTTDAAVWTGETAMHCGLVKTTV